MIKYLVTNFWESEAGTCGFECTAENSVEEWLKDNQSFLEKYPDFKITLVNVFPIPEEILKKLNDAGAEEEGIESKISYSY